MVHPDKVDRYSGTLDDLAEDLGNLRYDALGEFLRLLAAKIDRDAGTDEKRGRTQLSAALRNAAGLLAGAATDIQLAWRISEPHLGGD